MRRRIRRGNPDRQRPSNSLVEQRKQVKRTINDPATQTVGEGAKAQSARHGTDFTESRGSLLATRSPGDLEQG
jgi:hypothetical protein